MRDRAGMARGWRWGAALGMGLVLLCAGRAVAAVSGGDQVRDEVMRARGDVTLVRQRVCGAAAGAARASCGTLQEAMTGLDQTKVVGQTTSSAADVAHGFTDAVASLLDAEHLITADVSSGSSGPRGKDAGGSDGMLNGVNEALKKVQQAQEEVAAEDSAAAGIAASGKPVEAAGNPNDGAAPGKVADVSQGKRAWEHGYSLVSVVAVCLNLAAVVGLACLVWAAPWSRRAGKKMAGDGGAGGFEQMREMASKAAGSYAVLLEQNKQLAAENERLRSELDEKKGREGGGMRTMEDDRNFSRERDEAEAGGLEAGDFDAGETGLTGLTKYGPGFAPIVMEPSPARQESDAWRAAADAVRQAGEAERGRRQAAVVADDPLADYRKARAMGDPEEEARFKRRYAPIYSLACTNLAQRGIAGARLTFRQDPRASFLAVTAGEGRTLLFPQFSKELAFTPGMMEGVFVYPEGAISELALTQAAEVEAAGEEWVLVRPGQFEHA